MSKNSPQGLRKNGHVQEEPARGAAFPDMDWFFANLSSLSRKYPDQWLAVVNQEVRACAGTAAELRERLRQLGIERPFISRTANPADLAPS